MRRDRGFEATPARARYHPGPMARTSKRIPTPDAMPLDEPAAAAPTVGSVPWAGSVLQVFMRARIAALARELGVVAPAETGTKLARIEALLKTSGLSLGDALAWMTRDGLKAVRRVRGFDDVGRGRASWPVA